MADPRILVSVAADAPPLIVLDQVENLRAFLPAATRIVLRLAPAMGVAPIDLAWMLPAGVHVHSDVGATEDPHGDNVRWALGAVEPFDSVLVHGSEDLYFRPGAASAGHLPAEAATNPLVYAGRAPVGSVVDRTADPGRAYAVSGVPRALHDPLRTRIRDLARATGARMRVDPPFEANDFVALTYAADVLADPSVLATWIAAFGPEDTATLAIQADTTDGAPIDRLFAAITTAGADAPDAPDLKLITAPPGSFAEALQRWSLDAVLRPTGSSAPRFLDDIPLVHPAPPATLVALAAVRGIASSRSGGA